MLWPPLLERGNRVSIISQFPRKYVIPKPTMPFTPSLQITHYQPNRTRPPGGTGQGVPPLCEYEPLSTRESSKGRSCQIKS